MHLNIINSQVNVELLEKAIETLMIDISFNEHTRLMTSNKTIKKITGYFFDGGQQEYMGIPFIQNDELDFGEIIVLTQKM